MKKIVSIIMVLVTVFTIVTVSMVPVSAGTSAYDEINNSEYAKVYPLKKSGKGIPYYDKLLKHRGTVTYGKSKTAWYDYADYLKLVDVFKNSNGVYVAKIKYSIGSNWATAYIPLSEITSNYKTIEHIKVKSTGKFYCATTKGGSKSYWVDKNDTVYKISESGDYIQIMFPMTGSGYWMIAWCSKSDYNKYCGIPVSSVKLTVTIGKFTTALDTSKTLKMTYKGQQYNIDAAVLPSNATNKTITWKSSDTSVVTVTSAGVVTAVSQGSAKITATAASGKSATLKVEVARKDATSISLNKSSVTLTGDNPTITLKATIKPADSTNKITWKSSNESIARVGNNGKVTALSEGKVTITATTSSGKKAKTTITCKDIFSPIWPCDIDKNDEIWTIYFYRYMGAMDDVLMHGSLSNNWNSFDISGDGGKIVATESGTVVYADWRSGGFGNTVIIEHSNGLRSLYGHLKDSSFKVSVGDKVEKGDRIATMGNTGNSTGTHLHFEIYDPDDLSMVIKTFLKYFEPKYRSDIKIGDNCYNANQKIAYQTQKYYTWNNQYKSVAATKSELNYIKEFLNIVDTYYKYDGGDWYTKK